MPPKKKKPKHSPPGDVESVPGLSVAEGSDGEGSDSSASSLDSMMVNTVVNYILWHQCILYISTVGCQNGPIR